MNEIESELHGQKHLSVFRQQKHAHWSKCVVAGQKLKIFRKGKHEEKKKKSSSSQPQMQYGNSCMHPWQLRLWFCQRFKHSSHLCWLAACRFLCPFPFSCLTFKPHAALAANFRTHRNVRCGSVDWNSEIFKLQMAKALTTSFSFSFSSFFFFF